MREVAEVLADLESDYAGCIVRYAKNPVEFSRDILRMDPQPWQAVFMTAVSRARFGLPNLFLGFDEVGAVRWSDSDAARMKFAVRSGTGVGKTSGVSALILWHTACFPDSKIPCTAPTAPQIKAVLWPELRKWVASIPEVIRPYFPFEVTGDQVKFLENMAVARTAREETPEAFQGFHAKNIMLVADEASGIPEAIYMAGQGVMSSHGAISILIGNPTRAAGYFFDAFHSDSADYWTMRVGCDDPTLVSPKIVNPKYVSDMRRKHGENSYEFKVRVLGDFHLEDAGIIIPRPWIEAAVDRAVEVDSDWIVWGVDVSDGRDRSAVAKRRGNTLLERTKSWGGKDVMQLVGIIADEYWSTPENLKPHEICVDAIGMGIAFARRLKEVLTGEPVKVTHVNVSETGAKIGERFVSKRVELWSWGRDWFESMTSRIPYDPDLIAQLSSVEWEVKDSNGKWYIPDKKVSGKSPDHADAFLLTFGGLKGRHKISFTKGSRAGTLMGSHSYAVASASYLKTH